MENTEKSEMGEAEEGETEEGETEEDEAEKENLDIDNIASQLSSLSVSKGKDTKKAEKKKEPVELRRSGRLRALAAKRR